MTDNFYITTTLPYVNDRPHIGHTLEFIQADVIVRFKREKLGKDKVWFNVGTDEHGLKIYQKALSENMTPEAYTEKFANEWKRFCEMYLITYDTFYRTSEEYHAKPAQAFWEISNKNGDIYKKKYEGLYCVGCEEFKTEKELVDGNICPLHNKAVIEFSEENYFFKLSKYKEELLSWLSQNPDVVKPKHKVEELKNWISNMEDISISRLKKNLPWGVEVPNDPEQVMYVWFDALTNYVNVLGFPDQEEKLNSWWPGVQIFGPDNLRFQGAIWQGMLSSAGLPHTKNLLCHGMILDKEGKKMSKTVGNVVSPFEQFDKFGAEAVRFYMIAGISTFGDSPYKEDDLINLYNARLANNFGNLLNRVIVLSEKLGIEINDESKVETEFKNHVDNLKNNTEAAYSDFELQTAADTINELANYGNEYITLHQPWNKEVSEDRRSKTLNNLSYLLKIVTKLYSPIIPTSSERAFDMLTKKESGVLFTKIEITEK